MSESYLTPSPSQHKERGEIDTTVPYETVKEAVTLFGEIADLKTCSAEKRSPNGHVLYFSIAEELRESKEQLEVAENAKAQALHELSETKTLLGEVTNNLTEAIASKETSLKALKEASFKVAEAENARLKETETTYALWQVELESLKKQHCVALVELELLRAEIENLRSELQHITEAKAVAEKMVEEAKYSADEALQKAEHFPKDLSESQAVAATENSARVDAEGARLAIEASKEAEVQIAAEAAEETQKELENLRKEVAALKELESQVLDVGVKLESSRKELVAIKETNFSLAAAAEEANAKLNQALVELEKTRMAESVAVAKLKSTLKELEEIREQLQRSSAQNVSLVAMIESLRAELHSSKLEIESLRETEAIAASAAAASSAEMIKLKEELVVALAAEGKTKEAIVNLTTSLQRASMEADDAKALLERAHEDLKKAKLETEQAKAASNTLESRLQAAYREVEAAKAAEAIATTEFESLKAKEDAPASNEDGSSTITIPKEAYEMPKYQKTKEEYDALKIKLQEVDDVAAQKVSAVLAELNDVKSREQDLVVQLEKANAETDSSKRAENQALQKAENAEAAKVAVEGELRKWRAENEQRRKATDAAAVSRSPLQTSAARTSLDLPERGQRIESLGQVLHIKFPPPADRVYPVEKQSTIKKRQRLLARIRSYLARKAYSLKSFKNPDKVDV